MSELTRSRRAAGYTQGSFAAAFGREAVRLGLSAAVSVRQVRRWENETPPPLPHPGQQAVLETLFGVPLAEMGFQVPAHRRATAPAIGDDGEVKRRTFVTATGAIATAVILPESNGPRVGTHEVALLRAHLADLYTVDHRSGGIPAQARAERFERQVTRVLNGSVLTGRVGRELHTMLCEIACHKAWFGYDTGPAGTARTDCVEALTAAQLIDDPLLQVRALNTLVLLSVNEGGPGRRPRPSRTRTGSPDGRAPDRPCTWSSPSVRRRPRPAPGTCPPPAAR